MPKNNIPADDGLVTDAFTETGQALAAKVAKGELALNAKDYGAQGDGVADDTAAINAAIQAAVGRTVLVPPGTYMIDATDSIGAGGQPAGIKMNVAGVTLRLDGATLKCITNAAGNYSVVQVTAAGCTIEGGTIEGDRLAHTGAVGEWGHCLDINAGADRFTAHGVRLVEAWGDGCQVMGKPLDVSFIDCHADSNRRQGLSIIDAIRPRVIGGAYNATTGAPGTVGLGCGILLEPDANTTREVTDALVSGVLAVGNSGPGIATSSNGRPLSATITACRASGNGTVDSGNFRVYGAANRTSILGCEARDSVGAGYIIEADCVGVALSGCTAVSNATSGFSEGGTRSTLTACVSSQNVGAGFRIGSTSESVTLSACIAHGNSSGPSDVQIDIFGSNAHLIGVASDAGATTPNFGYVVRGGAVGARLDGCTARGSFGSGAYLNQANAVAFPLPGAASITTPPLTVSGEVTAAGVTSTSTIASFLGSSSDTGYSARVVGDAVDRVLVRADGAILFSNGADASDAHIYRTGAGSVGVSPAMSLRTGSGATASRPSAATAGAGSSWLDSTLNRPIWSDGTSWRDAAGTIV